MAGSDRTTKQPRMEVGFGAVEGPTPKW
jgi:hypothetical protein